MNISGLTDYDYVKLVATWYYNIEDRFQCDSVKSKYKGKRGEVEKIESIERRNGCKNNNTFSGYVEKASGNILFQVDNVIFYNCFCNYVDPISNSILYLFSQYEKGHLPYEGAVSEQPAKIIEAFNVLESLKLEKQKEIEEKAKRASKCRK